MGKHENHAAAGHGYERSTIDSRRIALSFAMLVAILVATAIATYWLMRDSPTDRQLPLVAPDSRQLHLPPAPRLQSAPSRDIAAYRRAQAARLHEYRWIDPRRGVVQIPIERAMAIEVARARSTQEVREGVPR